MAELQECPGCGRLITVTPGNNCPLCGFDMTRTPGGTPTQDAADFGDHRNPAGRDRNLLFGIFAIQMRFISGDDFVAAAAAWSTEPEVSLSERLVNSNAMSAADRDLVNSLIAKAIEHYDGDATVTLDRMGGEAGLAKQFTAIDAAQRDVLGRTLGVRLDIEDASGDDVVAMEETPGRYTRDSEYTRGGMGRILLVHDEYLSRDIALKELLPDRDPSHPMVDGRTPVRAASSQVVRFLREAKVTGQLEHPSIVPVHEVGRRADGTLYYTMKLVRGETLGKALQSAGTQPERLRYLSHFHDLCQAIAYAHSRNVIHRDIKPSNIMIGEFGETVVIDWGLAKIIGQVDADESELAKTWSRMQDEPLVDIAKTTPGARVGTPQYMAPEQAEGRISDIDERSDVFSLGVVLYEILTGNRPFAGNSTRELLECIRHAEPAPVHQIAPAAPAELVSICERAMKKARHDRYPSAKELAEDVERFLTGAIVQAYEYSPVELLRRVYRRNRAAINTALAALVLLCILGAASYVKVVRSRNEAIAARDVAESTGYLNQVRLAHSYLVQRNFPKAREVLWSTDPGRRHWEWGYLLNRAHQELYTINGDRGFAVSHDGSIVAGLYRSQPVGIYDGSSGERLHELPSESGLSLLHAEFSPDDKQLLTLTNHGQLEVWDTESWEQIESTGPHNGTANSAVFLPDGRILTTGENGTADIRIAGMNEVQISLVASESQVRGGMFSSDASRIAARVGKSNVQVWDVSAGESICLIERDADIRQVRFSPNGTLVAMSIGDTVELWDANEARLLHTVHGGHTPVTWIEFNSSGERVLVSGGRGQAIAWNAGTGEKLLEISTGYNALLKSMWSPDESLICTVPYKGEPMIWDAETGQLVNTVGQHLQPVARSAFFPDSTRIISSSYDQTIKIWSARANSSQQVIGRADSDIEQISLSDDASRLAILDSTGLTAVVDLETSETLAEVSIGSGSSLARISPDGRFVVVTLDHYHPSVFDVESNEFVATSREHTGRITALSVSPESDVVASAGWDGSVQLWSPTTGELLTSIKHEGQPTQLSFSPDGRRLAIGDAVGRIVICDSRSGDIQQILNDHSDRIVALKWSDDGNLLAAGGGDSRTILYEYDGRTAVQRYELIGHRDPPRSFVFPTDSQRLLSCSGDSLRVWNTASGVELLALTDSTERSSVIVSFGDGGELLAASGPYLRRWTPFSRVAVSSAANPEDAFQNDRRSRLVATPARIALTQHDTVATVTADTRMQKFLNELKRAVESDSDAVSVSEDGLKILTAEEDGFFILLQPLDIVRSISNQSITDVPSALQAIDTAMASIENRAASLQMQIDRAMTQKRLVFYVEPVTTEAKTISLTRPDAIEICERLKDGIRQQLLDPPEEDVWLSGARLPMSLTQDDRNLYLKSHLAPDNVIVRVDDESVTDLQSLLPIVDGLLNDLKSGQRSSIEVEVMRGAFHSTQLAYKIDE